MDWFVYMLLCFTCGYGMCCLHSIASSLISLTNHDLSMGGLALALEQIRREIEQGRAQLCERFTM